ncbi:hypothetical protein F2Y49_24920, partial [Bacteroides caccae]
MPQELDPMLEPAFQPPADIVRPLTAEETAQREKDLAPIPSAPLTEDGEKALSVSNAQDAEVDEQINGFRQKYNVSIHATPAEVTAAPADSGMEKTDKETPTEITYDDGLYFDMKEGVLVYMKNVHVRNPEFSLDCTGPLKIYMQYVEKKGKKKPSDRKKEEGKEIDKSGPVLPNDGNFDFNSIKKVTASGNVVLRYTDKDGNLCTAKAEKATYDANTGEIILAGNYPSLSRGGSFFKSDARDGFIRVYGNGNVYIPKGGKSSFRDLDKQ